MSAMASSFSLQSTHTLHQDNEVLENQLPMFDAIEEHSTTVIQQSVTEHKNSHTLQLSLFGNTHELSQKESSQQLQASLDQQHLAQQTMKERKRIQRPSSEVYSSQEPNDKSIDDAINPLASNPLASASIDSADVTADDLPSIELPIDELDAQTLQEIDGHELPDDVLQELQNLASELPDELREQFLHPPTPVSPPEHSLPKVAKPLSRRTLLRRIATDIGVATWFDDDSEGWMWEDEISGKTAFRAVRNEEKALEEALTEVIQNSYPYLSDNDVELILADPANYQDIMLKAKSNSITKKTTLGDIL